MGWALPPVYGKDDKAIDKKIDKINKKIAKLEEERAIYEEKKSAKK